MGAGTHRSPRAGAPRNSSFPQGCPEGSPWPTTCHESPESKILQAEPGGTLPPSSAAGGGPSRPLRPGPTMVGDMSWGTRVPGPWAQRPRLGVSWAVSPEGGQPPRSCVLPLGAPGRRAPGHPRAALATEPEDTGDPQAWTESPGPGPHSPPRPLMGPGAHEGGPGGPRTWDGSVGPWGSPCGQEGFQEHD